MTILADATIRAGAGSAWEGSIVGTHFGQGVSLVVLVVVCLYVCFDVD